MGTKETFDESFSLLDQSRSRSLDAPIQKDIEEQLHEVSSSVYVRVPFSVEVVDDLTALRMDMQYEDGFVVFINGTEVMRSNAPQELAHNATALVGRDDDAARKVERFDLRPHLNVLHEGQNVLAIHGLNLSENAPDMLLRPHLTASVQTDALTLAQSTTVKARTFDLGIGSALNEAPFQMSEPSGADNTQLAANATRKSKRLILESLPTETKIYNLMRRKPNTPTTSVKVSHTKLSAFHLERRPTG